MAITTIPQAIERGYLSVSLVGNANAKGALFGGKIAAPGSQRTIQMISDALSWGYDGGAQTEQDLRQMANYLVWLIGVYGLEAAVMIDGGGGGSVVPGGGGGSAIFPLYITSANFESDGISYNNPQIVGFNLIVFVNEYVQQWLAASGTTFSYTSSGIVMNIPGFDANTQDWTIVIDRYTN